MTLGKLFRPPADTLMGNLYCCFALDALCPPIYMCSPVARPEIPFSFPCAAVPQDPSVNTPVSPTNFQIETGIPRTAMRRSTSGDSFPAYGYSVDVFGSAPACLGAGPSIPCHLLLASERELGSVEQEIETLNLVCVQALGAQRAP